MKGMNAMAAYLPQPGSFSYKGQNMSDKVRDTLRKFDVNDDEQLDIAEVTALVEHLLAEESQNKQLRYAIIFLAIFTSVMLAGMFGLTWAVVYALKDTKLDNGSQMVTKQGLLVQVGSADYATVGGVTVPRTAEGKVAPNATVAITREDGSIITASATNSVRTAVFSGTKIANISSLIRIQSLMELNHMFFTAPSGAELALRVMGVARIPKWESVWGSIVKIVTPVGTIELDDTRIAFEDTLAPLFLDAGFSSSPLAPGRRLLQSNENTPANAAGTFNYVDQKSFTPNTNVWKYDDLATQEAVRARGAELLEVLDKITKENDGTAQTDLLAAWKRFARSFEKRADNASAEAATYGIFQDNLATVAAINTDPASPFYAGANWYSDLKWDEFVSDVLANNRPPPKERLPPTRRFSRRLLADLPKAVDWRTEGVVTPVRTQGRCGCCWAFAAVAAMESAVLIANKTLPAAGVDLSESQTAFCCKASGLCPQSDGCKGGTPVDALAYIKQAGLTTEANAPYNTTVIGRLGIECPVTTASLATAASNASLVNIAEDPVMVPDGSEQELLAAVAQGPVITYMNSNKEFQQYAGGVYPPEKCTTYVNHIVLIVGYDTQDKVWIVKNSWGEQWGEKGFFRLPFTGDGPGPCGLYQYSFSLAPKFTNLNLRVALPAGQNATTTASTGTTTKASTGNTTKTSTTTTTAKASTGNNTRATKLF